MGISSLPRITHILGGRAGNEIWLTFGKRSNHVSVPQRCPYIGFMLALFSVTEVCKQKALESPPNSPTVICGEVRYQEGDTVSQPLSEHTWQVQKSEVLFRTCIFTCSLFCPYKCTFATRNSLRYDLMKMYIVQLFNLTSCILTYCAFQKGVSHTGLGA